MVPFDEIVLIDLDREQGLLELSLRDDAVNIFFILRFFSLEILKIIFIMNNFEIDVSSLIGIKMLWNVLLCHPK